jgi:hypothetical protein
MAHSQRYDLGLPEMLAHDFATGLGQTEFHLLDLLALADTVATFGGASDRRRNKSEPPEAQKIPT